MKYCVDAEWLELLIDLGFIHMVCSHDDLSDDQLKSYLTKKAEETKSVVTIDTLNRLVETELHTDMTDINARSRIENYVFSYKSLLPQSGLIWQTND